MFKLISSLFHNEQPVNVIPISLEKTPDGCRKNVYSSSDSSIDNKYLIVTSEKGQETPENANYRSVVFRFNNHPDKRRVVSYSIPRSMEAKDFAKKHPDLTDQRYIATKTVEGTGINLFYDLEDECWQISTKNAVGGNYGYFLSTPKKTFRDMFLDVFNEHSSYISEECGNVARDIRDIPWINSLNKNYTYCFVLQHPDNHIIFPVIEPRLYLVAVYKTRDTLSSDKSIQNIESVSYGEYSKWNTIFEGVTKGIIHFPERVERKPTTEAYYAAYCAENKPADKVGVMIWDEQTYNRVHLENEGYKVLKELRGNSPIFTNHYVKLLKTNRVRDFLIAFPMYKEQVYKLYSTYHNLITLIHNYYVKYYVNKNKEMIEKSIFVHVARIHHSIYLESEKKTKITHREVRKYFDNLDEATLAHLLNKYSASDFSPEFFSA